MALAEISRGGFFERFEEQNLAFLYQDKTKDGKRSRFSKFISREKSKERPCVEPRDRTVPL